MADRRADRPAGTSRPRSGRKQHVDRATRKANAWTSSARGWGIAGGRGKGDLHVTSIICSPSASHRFTASATTTTFGAAPSAVGGIERDCAVSDDDRLDSNRLAMSESQPALWIL